MQREEQPVMATGLERIAAKARCEPKLRFTSLAHHITGERVWENLCHIPSDSAPGVDGQTVAQAKESFEAWIEPMLESVHRQGYRAPAIRRVYIPKRGQAGKAAPGRALCRRPGAPTQHRRGVCCPPSTSRISCRVPSVDAPG
jgi:RNA-directed DNA polymerase